MGERRIVWKLGTCVECGGGGEVPVTLDDARQLRIAWQGCAVCCGHGTVPMGPHPASVEGRLHKRAARATVPA